VANRRNYFYGQHITGRTISSTGELNQGFDGLEAADQNVVADFGLIGIAAGGAVSQHAPTADLTVDVTAVSAYDQQGRRVQVPSTQTVSLAQDSNSVSTAVVNAGNSKIVSLFIRFKRANSDPRQDKNGNTQNFVQDESFEFVVVQGAEGAGSPTPPALLTDGLLLADVTRTYAQTQIVNANISAARREDAFAISAGALSVRQGTPETALQALLTHLNNHVTGTASKHPASAIDYAGSPAWADASTIAAMSVEAAIDALVSTLAAATAGVKIGAAATGNWNDATPVASGTVQSVLNGIVSALAGQVAGSGAEKVGARSSTDLAAGSVYAQLVALAAGWGKLARGNVWTATQTFDAALKFDPDQSWGVLSRDDGPGTTFTDAVVTNIDLKADEYRIAAITAARSGTINAPLVEGRRVRIVKATNEAFTYDILKTGGGGLVRVDANTRCAIDLVAVTRSSVLRWVISAISVWQGSVSSVDNTI
jgi:hypothetical protein